MPKSERLVSNVQIIMTQFASYLPMKKLSLFLGFLQAVLRLKCFLQIWSVAKLRFTSRFHPTTELLKIGVKNIDATN